MAAVQNTAEKPAPYRVTSAAAMVPATAIRWLPAALVMAAAMLFGVLVVGLLSGEARKVPPSGPPFVVGNLSDVARTMGENLLVLLLYATGSVAAAGIQRWRSGKAQPTTARQDSAGRLATGMVVGLLLVVTCREVVVLGHGLAGFANYFYVPRWRLWLGVLPDALPELTAMLLPVAAWRYAGRRGQLERLPALTVIAVLAALPLLSAAALIEVYVSPKAFRALTCIGEREGFRGGGDCGTEPKNCPKLSPAEFERRFHLHLSRAEIADARRGCSTSRAPH